MGLKEYMYSKKFYKSFSGRVYRRVTKAIASAYDAVLDYKICKKSLVKYVPSPYRESRGSTGSQSTRYWFLDDMFSGAEFSEQDRFIDIGCGKGRVLAYMIKLGFKGEINGVELNGEVAQFTAEWAKRYKNVNVISGDAFELNYNNYDVFFLGRPFLPDMFKRFVEKFETEIDHPVKLYYWVDQQSGDYLDDRAGWTLERRKKVFMHGPLCLAPCPQRYSIWTYNPAEK